MLFLAAVILQSKQNNVGWCIALMDCGCEWCVHACVFCVCVTEMMWGRFRRSRIRYLGLLSVINLHQGRNKIDMCWVFAAHSQPAGSALWVQPSNFHHGYRHYITIQQEAAASLALWGGALSVLKAIWVQSVPQSYPIKPLTYTTRYRPPAPREKTNCWFRAVFRPPSKNLIKTIKAPLRFIPWRFPLGSLKQKAECNGICMRWDQIHLIEREQG